MADGFDSYLLRKRMELGMLGKRPVSQKGMAYYLSGPLTKELGRPVEVTSRCYNKWETGKTVPPYEEQIRKILGE